jgi:hypothetical protein
MSGGKLTVKIERMGRIKNLKASKEPPLREVWVLTKSPKYDLSASLVNLWRGYLLGSSSCDLVFGSYLRGVS